MNYPMVSGPRFPGAWPGRALEARAGVESPQPVGCNDSLLLFLSAIASILRAWLDQCAEDFREPPGFPCLQKLLHYLKQMWAPCRKMRCFCSLLAIGMQISLVLWPLPLILTQAPLPHLCFLFLPQCNF